MAESKTEGKPKRPRKSRAAQLRAHTRAKFEAPQFGELVKAAREERGWTTRDLAQAMGTTQRYVTAVENGFRGSPQWPTVYRFVHILGIPYRTLFGRNNPR
jgi:ribosome-binding protein aMBF1 (putative translation factor)